MKPITRIRIVLFALMIFGSFANFALNEWGNTLIIWCEILMATSFLGEVVFTLFKNIKINYRKKYSVLLLSFVGATLLFVGILIALTNFSKVNSELIPIMLGITFLVLILIIIIEALYDFFKKYKNQGTYESFFLCMFFIGLFFKNSRFKGSDILLLLGVLLLVPYFITSTIKFFKENYKSGKALVIVLTFGSITTILLGLAYMMKTMHWPFANFFFYTATAMTLVMIGGAIKWKYVFNGEKINILQGLRLFKTNVILLFFMLFVFTNYKHFVILKLAPDFYSADYPESYYKLRSSFDREAWNKAYEIRSAYDNFVQKAEENGFIK
jgi:hypothetical protein